MKVCSLSNYVNYNDESEPCYHTPYATANPRSPTDNYITKDTSWVSDGFFPLSRDINLFINVVQHTQ